MKEIVLMPIEISRESLPHSQIRFEILKKIIVPYTGSTVIFAKTESDQQVAIKVSAKKGGAEREWVGLTRAFEAGIPVPEPFALVKDLMGSVMGIVSKRVEGKSLYYHPNAETKDQLGQIVQEMHRQVPIDGREWIKSGKENFVYHDRFLFQWLKGSVDGLEAGSKTQVLLGLFADSMRAYCETVLPVFNHNDIHDGQVLIGDGKITLIDFENWVEDGPLNDIAFYLFHSIRTERPLEGFEYFLNGYLDKRMLTENEKSVLLFHLLFISSRAISYFHRYSRKYLETAKNTHQKVLDFVDKERLWKEL